MTNKYLIDEEKCFVAGFTKVSFEPSDAKEVEVLDEEQLADVEITFATSGFLDLSDYLKANNLLIIKIKE